MHNINTTTDEAGLNNKYKIRRRMAMAKTTMTGGICMSFTCSQQNMVVWLGFNCAFNNSGYIAPLR